MMAKVKPSRPLSGCIPLSDEEVHDLVLETSFGIVYYNVLYGSNCSFIFA